MNRQRTDRAASEDDLLLLPPGAEIGQAREHRVVFRSPTDSRRDSLLAIWGSTVDTSTPVVLLEDVESPVERRAEPWRVRYSSIGDTVQSEVPAESEEHRPIRALYETVSDLFEDDTGIAELLQVPEEQVEEWKRGSASDEEALDRLENLSAAVSKLRAIYESEVIRDWLLGLNAHLGGARPVDVLIRGQLSRVIAAIEAERGGAHA